MAKAPGRDGHEPPLVLIPGHMATALAWRDQVAALGRDRAVLVPDRHLDWPTMADMARAIALDLPPVFDLAGWSMGGYVLFELLPLVRERVRKVVLLHTSARPESAAARERRRELLERLRVEEPATVLREQLDANLFDPRRVAEPYKQALVADSVRLGLHTLRSQVGAMTERADARPGLGRIDREVLVVAGRHDRIAPVDAALEMAALMPRAHLHVFEDAAHCSPWEKCRELNALLRGFLGAGAA